MCDTGLKVFQLLQERNKLGPDNTEYLCRLLTAINRQDLSDKVSGGAWPGERTGRPPATRDELDAATDVLSNNLGRNWRKLGRKLGLTEVQLDSISGKHTDLEETAVELVKVWRRCKAEQASVPALIKALRDLELNQTADQIEDQLSSQTGL
ncbi:hypothetical protein WMY93_013021 [Mugilogobius chulae]|uniref:Death domain-containing protein n=1 Tax=Mugilogobius chulae TaxID=88201 RepID=A0AAW0P824_9GOBI